MAKKSKNNSVNLLKGITGSKLAKLLTIAAIVLAIPLTVFMSQKQQNTTQEASGDNKCRSNGGSCINLLRDTCSGTIKYGLCSGPKTRVCCVPKDGWQNKPSVVTCKNGTGRCVDKYASNPCPEGRLFPGYCSGPSNIQCCVPTGPDRCAADYPNGKCQYDNTACPGGYKSGLCSGPSNYKCCTNTKTTPTTTSNCGGKDWKGYTYSCQTNCTGFDGKSNTYKCSDGKVCCYKKP